MKILKFEDIQFTEIFTIPIKHKANGFRCVNIIIGKVENEDIDSMFGPLSGEEEFVEFNSKEKWCHLLASLGIFKSISQARKNGWDKPIDNGFSEVMFKKQRKIVFVFKAV